MRIRLSKLFECSPRGKYVRFEAGEYDVPAEMPSEIAGRALRSGVGKEVVPSAEKPRRKRAPKNKARGVAPENKGVIDLATRRLG